MKDILQSTFLLTACSPGTQPLQPSSTRHLVKAAAMDNFATELSEQLEDIVAQDPQMTAKVMLQEKKKAVMDAKHGEDNLTALEEKICEMPKDDGTYDTAVMRDLRKAMHKKMVMLNSFPYMDKHGVDVFFSGTIEKKGWYEHQDQHPIMSEGALCFKTASKVPVVCQMMEKHWDDGKRHNGRMIPTIITIFRTPILFPLIAALRHYFRTKGRKMAGKVEAVYPGGLHQIARFRKGEFDVLVLPIQLGLVSDLKFAQDMYHFEIIPDMQVQRMVEALAFEKPKSVHTMTEWFTEYDPELIKLVNGPGVKHKGVFLKDAKAAVEFSENPSKEGLEKLTEEEYVKIYIEEFVKAKLVELARAAGYPC